MTNAARIRSARRLVPFAALLITSAVFYALFAGELSLNEFWAGLPVSILACLHSAGLRRCAERTIRPTWRGATREAGRAAAAIPGDLIRVGRVLLSALPHRPAGEAGRPVAQAFAFGTDNPRDAARRAEVTLGLSLAPNGFVLRLSPDHLLLHRLAPAPARESREWPA